MKRLIILLFAQTLRTGGLEVQGYFDVQRNSLQNYFLFFYGQNDQVLQIPIALDLNYDQILLTSKELDERGIDCTKENQC